MLVVVYVPLLAAWLIGRAVGIRALLPKHPAIETWTLTIGSAVAALLSTWSLVLLATVGIVRVAYITERLHVVGGTLRRSVHVPMVVSVVALIMLMTRSRRLLSAARQGRRARLAAAVFNNRHPGPFVVVADSQPIAFALTGPRGHTGNVVISTAVLSGLPDAERRAVLAHEYAHLSLHHHVHRRIVRLAVAMAPTVGSAWAELEWAMERWADERAAPTTLQRRNVASAIGTFRRLAGTTTDVCPENDLAFVGGLAFAQSNAELRIDALLDSPPSRRTRDILPVAAIVALMGVATCDATHQLAHLFRAALH